MSATLSTPIDQKHTRSRSDNILMKLTPPNSSSSSISSSSTRIKRSYDDYLKDSSSVSFNSNKKARTAPPSPPYDYSKRSKSLSPILKKMLMEDELISPNSSPKSIQSSPQFNNYKLINENDNKIEIKSGNQSQIQPQSNKSIFNDDSIDESNTSIERERESSSSSIETSMEIEKPQERQETYSKYLNQKIIPSISLNYYDTYHSNLNSNIKNEIVEIIKENPTNYSNYKYEMNKLCKLPSISTILSNNNSNINNISNYNLYSTNENYNNNGKIVLPSPKPSISYLNEKIKNFPYESNYNYLNKNYLKDIENYPNYLKAAESLLDLSNTHDNIEKIDEPRTNIKLPTISDLHPMIQPINYNQSPTIQQNMNNYNQYYKPYNNYINQSQQRTIPKKKLSHTSPKMSPKSPKSPKSPNSHHHTHNRKCISCGSDQSPCWRPSWSIKSGQLCNSCGLRYKKTGARCLNSKCGRIPAKGEWTVMKNRGKFNVENTGECYLCLHCGSGVEVNDKH